MATPAAAGASASTTALRRLHRDLEILQKSQNPQIAVRPSDCMLIWHFVLHSLPSDTPYAGGCYHGKIIFPEEYPHKPPAITMVTPSGRLEVGMKLCLSMTDYHPESWNPAWSVETILVGLLSFFISDKERGTGSIQRTADVRRQLALASWEANAKDAEFRELFPELAGRPQRQEEPSVPAATHDISAGPDLSEVSTRPSQNSPFSACVVSSGDQMEASEAAAAAQEEQEEPVECWICRDTSLDEPLIQPCACRGSMSGVHASCVEQWIAHHRQNATNSDPPRCSVCHQTYVGQERRPGLCRFASHLCWEGAQQVLRILAILTVLYAFWCAAMANELKWRVAWPWRVLLISIFSIMFIHKILVLTISQIRPPPQNYMRYFHTTDHKVFTMHLAEAVATLSIMGAWSLSGMLTVWYFLPYLLIALIPLTQLWCPHGPSRRCFWEIFKVILTILALPVLLLAGIVTIVQKYRARVLHPLEAGWPIYISITSMVLCLACESNVPVLVLWAVHSAFLSLGILEHLFVRRLQWYNGPAWWFALQLTALAAYLANLYCKFPKGVEYHGSTIAVVRMMSWIWSALVTVLVLRINWHHVEGWYQTWQQRHGHFTLNVQRSQGGQTATAGAASGRSGSVLPM
mmetsp:Transcript_66136/g.158204  ORF Transcript_66136/g.158204 Transcript_66136/m.158204 type:complete len:633 (+) Transcript_66136:140-2038(+)